ncbi:MAG: hypothetical protein A2186_00420 [Candidatus Levybacteria bacterium RIFOXYA1_FULL_41_10]|nr:MAG: hypothetical protein UT87_C0010G0015 [Candidatus Levybacteria bacterium GW2011_GWC1_40_19]KKR73163.1 MAG: hypothetical protein UU15_C0017G0002 [Candidatus Levybacteria bacterium GW2011_GWC2_40_7]KKR94065.1 MAG: hypothetical protein UU45_C0017G0014 [Candidatus Levybacteria bacterium GW2011_GWA2_41_15]KKS00597.1 MAG: hypothetical protein UU52_C0030G0013 [Candidatus Levybacteria bacterium GW2011_GWB1_41_21]OGH21124.1 MAG: hypothetical protein A2695_02620 [Candidatus Levybacteria bacterium 
MDDKFSSSLILLTYKNKALLMYRQNSAIDEEKHAWSFIGGTKATKESFEDALGKIIEKEMGIRVENVEFVSRSCYHACLTDDNVNHIQRAEGQTLAFFTLKELQKLLLSSPTREFVSRHGSLITAAYS